MNSSRPRPAFARPASCIWPRPRPSSGSSKPGSSTPASISSTPILTRAEAAELMPGLTGNWTGALYTASDGKAEPQRAAPAIAEAARRHGAAIVTQCAVRGLETEGGRVSAVVTEKGRISCDKVVLAGGAWCRLFCGNLGVVLPQLKVLA